MQWFEHDGCSQPALINVFFMLLETLFLRSLQCQVILSGSSETMSACRRQSADQQSICKVGDGRISNDNTLIALPRAYS